MRQVLSDDDKRQMYDRFGEAGLKGASGFGGAPGGGMGGMNSDFRCGGEQCLGKGGGSGAGGRSSPVVAANLQRQCLPPTVRVMFVTPTFAR